LRKLHGDKIVIGIEVVLARFVDDPKLVELGRGIVGNSLIELAQLKRCRVSLILNANYELRFGFSLH